MGRAVCLNLVIKILTLIHTTSKYVAKSTLGEVCVLEVADGGQEDPQELGPAIATEPFDGHDFLGSLLSRQVVIVFERLQRNPQYLSAARMIALLMLFTSSILINTTRA